MTGGGGYLGGWVNPYMRKNSNTVFVQVAKASFNGLIKCAMRHLKGFGFSLKAIESRFPLKHPLKTWKKTSENHFPQQNCNKKGWYTPIVSNCSIHVGLEYHLTQAFSVILTGRGGFGSSFKGHGWSPLRG